MSFPTAGILDNFDRADTSLGGGSDGWAILGFMTGNNPPGLEVISNQMGKGGTGWHNANWNTSFGADQEVFITVSTLPAANGETICFLFCRGANPGSPSTVTAYGLHIGYNSSGAENWTFYRINGTTQTSIGSATATGVSSGDSVGFAVIGTQLQAWHKPAAGSWTQIGTLTDPTFTAAGYIGIEIQNTVSRFDNFGGGAVTITGASGAAVLSGGGAQVLVKQKNAIATHG